MPTIRSLRRSRGLTLVELALLAGIPARLLGQIEYGLLRLDPDSRARLALVFGLAPELLHAGVPPTHHPTADRGQYGGVHLAASPLVAALIGALLLAPPAAQRLPAPTVTRPARAEGVGPPSRALTRLIAPVAGAVPSPTTRPTPIPTPAATAAPTPTPAFTTLPDGPHGCPLVARAGRIVITQGYGVGTHAPASVWGALDLAIDGDGDGAPEPDSTRGALIVATHGGVARVFLGSWPGGNFVRIVDAQAGWSTAYAHLDTVFVADGQALTAGTPIGTTGSTGFASGPHLHYEVWHGTENVDPTGLIGCG